MIGIVTGAGPRVGTSFTMLSLKNAGIPIKGYKNLDSFTVPEKNKEGYWELHPFDLLEQYRLGLLNNHFIKIWPPLLPFINPKDIGCIVILDRKDKEQHKKSFYSLLEEEKKLPRWQNITAPTAEDIFAFYKKNIQQFLTDIDATKILNVYTEDLNTEITNVIKFAERGLTCQY
jgi:hypothetical protein